MKQTFIDQLNRTKYKFDNLKAPFLHPLENCWSEIGDDAIDSSPSHGDKNFREHAF